MTQSNILRHITILAASAMGIIATNGAADAGNLDSKSIRSLFPGQFVAVVQGYRINVSASAGGSLAGEAYGYEDRGRWSVKGSSLCITWSEWNKGKTTCGKVSQKSGWFVASGTSGQVLKFRRAAVAGN